jgi:hypothetical protein
MKLDIHKFSWSELFSNGNGKTSATAFCGIIICMVGSLCFLLGCIDKMFITSTVDVISQSIVFVGLFIHLFYLHLLNTIMYGCIV